MKGRRRRRRVSRDRREIGWNGKLLITVLLCGFFLFIAAILLGNYLRTLTPADTEELISDTAEEADTEAVSGYDSHAIIGRAVTFDSVLDTPADTSADADDTGDGVEYDSLSILLRYPDASSSDGDPDEQSTGMKICYTSPVVLASGLENPGSVNIRDGIAALRLTTDVKYISAVFYISYVNFEGSFRDEIRDYEMSLLYELFEYGISETVICGFGISDEDVEEAALFASELKARSGSKCIVGIAFPFDFYGESASYGKMREQDLGSAFFAMDLVSVEVPGLMSPEDVVYDRVRRTISLAVAYNVRVVVGCGDTSDPDSQVAAAIRGGASNVQGIIKW